MDPLEALSPLDGRYATATRPLASIFSERRLLRYRLMIEVEYLIALGNEPKVKEVKKYRPVDVARLRRLYQRFSLADAAKIKTIEQTTNHDVKAVEYFLKDKLKRLRLADNVEFTHFALTSEDVNNLAYSLMLQEGIATVIVPTLTTITKTITAMARRYKAVPLLALTHGQPASPTTFGKEFAVFARRLAQQLAVLQAIRLEGKFSGATGTYAAAHVAYPSVNWPAFAKKFIERLGLRHNPLTTQIEPHDTAAAVYDAVARCNSIVRDFDQDCWLYIGRGVLGLKRHAGEIGSSTMPHKINPIHFENSEGNLVMANALLRALADKLPISRLQRDLTDSTILRNQGVALGYSFLAYSNTLKGLERLEINRVTAAAELEAHWEVLAEPIQTVLRKVGYDQPYEKLKELTRGQAVDKKTIRNFISSLAIPKKEKAKLLKLTPATYTGLAAHLTSSI